MPAATRSDSWRIRWLVLIALLAAAVAVTVPSGGVGATATPLVVIGDEPVAFIDQPVTFDPLVNDEGADPTTLQVLNQPLSGTAVAEDGKITFTPAPGGYEPGLFLYEVCAPGGDPCDSAPIDVRVRPWTDHRLRLPANVGSSRSTWLDGNGVEPISATRVLTSPDGALAIEYSNTYGPVIREVATGDPIPASGLPGIVDASWSPDSGGGSWKLAVQTSSFVGDPGNEATLGTVVILGDALGYLAEFEPLSWTELLSGTTYNVLGEQPTWSSGSVVFTGFQDNSQGALSLPGLYEWIEGSGAPPIRILDIYEYGIGGFSSGPGGKLAIGTTDVGTGSSSLRTHVSMVDDAPVTIDGPYGGYVQYTTPMWSPDGRVLATRAGDNQMITRPGSVGPRVVVRAAPPTIGATWEGTATPTLLPWRDGGRIAYVRRGAFDEGDRIDVINADGSGHDWLWQAPADAAEREIFDLAASADGSVIAAKVGIDPNHVRIVHDDGSTTWPAIAGVTTIHGVELTPDGGRLVLDATVSGLRGIWIAPLTGTSIAPVRSTPGAQAFDPAVSADGTRVAFFESIGSETSVWVSDLDGSNAALITSVASGVSLTGTDAISWSPDGTTLALTSNGELRLLHLVPNGSTLALDSSTVVRTALSSIGSPSWSPDGTALAWERATQDGSAALRSVYIANADSSREISLHVEADHDSALPVWFDPPAPTPPTTTTTTTTTTTIPAGPTFWDVGATHPFLSQITWLVGQSITNGYADGGFHPTAPVTRQSIAAFLYRLAGSPAGPFADPGFNDVGPTHPFRDPIAWMVSNGITNGYADGGFHPTAPVTRQSIAAFLHRYDGEPAGPFADPGFNDVGPTHPFRDPIAWMVTKAITNGYADGGFHPTAPVTRQSIAAFLERYATA